MITKTVSGPIKIKKTYKKRVNLRQKLYMWVWKNKLSQHYTNTDDEIKTNNSNEKKNKKQI